MQIQQKYLKLIVRDEVQAKLDKGNITYLIRRSLQATKAIAALEINLYKN